MKTKSLKVLGLDVSKDNVTCCVLEKYPDGGVANYWVKTRNQLHSTYPRFYSNPKGSEKSAYDFVDWVKDIKPGMACMEPTGHHYSKLWYTLLEEIGVKVLWIGHVELKRHREGKNLPGKGKSDEVDALAMASYPHDSETQNLDGTLNLNKFLIVQNRAIARVRELVMELDHLARVQNPLINYFRQRLAWEFPEVAHRNGHSQTEYVPPLFGWVAQDTTNTSHQGWVRMEKEYEKSIAPKFSIAITPFTRLHARWLVDVHMWEQLAENELTDLLSSPEFQMYQHIFDGFGFGLRTRARLLSRIYPFESFLLPNGKPWIERTQKFAPPTKRSRRRKSAKCDDQPNTTKTTKRNRSRDCFKLRLGMGMVKESSGESTKLVPGGSSICRKALWLYVLTLVETGRLPDTAQSKTLLEYRDYLKSQTDGSGKPLIKGKLIQMKLMSKTTNMLFAEFARAFRVV